MDLVVAPEVVSERVAIVTWFLMSGHRMRTAEIATLTGISRQGAFALMERISRVLPIRENDETWEMVTPE